MNSLCHGGSNRATSSNNSGEICWNWYHYIHQVACSASTWVSCLVGVMTENHTTKVLKHYFLVIPKKERHLWRQSPKGNHCHAEIRMFWKTKTQPCLLMPWLLMLPGHRQPWYWLCNIWQTGPCVPWGIISNPSPPSQFWEIIENASILSYCQR